MQVRARLLKVGSMAESLGVYVPAMMLQKALGLGRLFLFLYLMPRAEFGLWGLGLTVFLVATPIATLGANHGLTRYVSLYEARGKLVAFYHRVQNRCILVVLAATAIGIVASPWITNAVIVSGSGTAPMFSYRYQLYVCLAALANVLVGGLYYDLLSFLFGMRAYRLASVAEVGFSVIFTLVGVVGLALWPTALTLLSAHFVSQAVVLLGSVILLQGALRQAEGYRADGKDWLWTESEAGAGEGRVPVADTFRQATDVDLRHAFRRVLQFGFVAMIGNILWIAAQQISLVVTNRSYGKEDAGVFNAFLQLSQGVLLVSNSAFAVVFAHVARRWEAFSPAAAMRTLETAYKAVTIAMMAMTLVILATGRGWVALLPAKYHQGLALLGGLLMFFQGVSNLALLTSVARLRERPIVIAVAALAGGAANTLLALWWTPVHGPAGAAWAAGVGMMAGGTTVMLVYFLAAHVRLQPVTYLLMVCPLLLLLPIWAAAAVWAAVVLAALVSPLLFARQEKRDLAHVVSHALRQFFRKRAA